VKLIKRNIEALAAPKEARSYLTKSFLDLVCGWRRQARRCRAVPRRRWPSRPATSRYRAFGKITPEDARTEAKKSWRVRISVMTLRISATR
jgi:hypothetical protein